MWELNLKNIQNNKSMKSQTNVIGDNLKYYNKYYLNFEQSFWNSMN